MMLELAPVGLRTLGRAHEPRLRDNTFMKRDRDDGRRRPECSNVGIVGIFAYTPPKSIVASVIIEVDLARHKSWMQTGPLALVAPLQHSHMDLERSL